MIENIQAGLENGDLVICKKGDSIPFIPATADKTYENLVLSSLAAKSGQMIVATIPPIVAETKTPVSYFNYNKVLGTTKIEAVGNFVLAKDGNDLKAFNSRGEYIDVLLTYSSVDREGLVYQYYDFAVSPDNTKIAIINSQGATIDLYEIIVTDSTIRIGDRLSTFGVWKRRGEIVDGKIYAFKVVFGSDSELLIYGYNYGYETDNVTQLPGTAKSISLFTITDNKLVFTKTLLSNTASGSFSLKGEIGAVISMKESLGKIIIVNDVDEVAIYTYALGELTLDEIIPLPTDMDVSNLVLSSAILTDVDTISVVVKSISSIITAKKIEGKWTIVGMVGRNIFDDIRTPKFPINGFKDIYDITYLPVTGEVLVADYGNRRISKVVNDNTIDIRYILPAGEKVFTSLPVGRDGDLTQERAEEILDLTYIYIPLPEKV